MCALRNYINVHMRPRVVCTARRWNVVMFVYVASLQDPYSISSLDDCSIMQFSADRKRNRNHAVSVLMLNDGFDKVDYLCPFEHYQ